MINNNIKLLGLLSLLYLAKMECGKSPNSKLDPYLIFNSLPKTAQQIDSAFSNVDSFVKQQDVVTTATTATTAITDTTAATSAEEEMSDEYIINNYDKVSTDLAAMLTGLDKNSADFAKEYMKIAEKFARVGELKRKSDSQKKAEAHVVFDIDKDGIVTGDEYQETINKLMTMGTDFGPIQSKMDALVDASDLTDKYKADLKSVFLTKDLAHFHHDWYSSIVDTHNDESARTDAEKAGLKQAIERWDYSLHSLD